MAVETDPAVGLAMKFCITPELLTTPAPSKLRLAAAVEPSRVNVKGAFEELMVMPPSVIVGVESVPLIVGLNDRALVSNVATSEVPFGRK